MDIKSVVKDNVQEIIIIKDGIEKTIHILERANKNHFCRYVIDNNYVIIYHDRRDQEGYHYIDVRCVYDLNKDEKLDLSQSTYHRIKNMYVKKEFFSVDTVMSYLLNIVSFDNKKIRDFYNFMSSYNPSITKEDIKREVIKQYPIIEKYLSSLVYIFNKKQLVNELRGGFISFYAIKQDIEELDHLERIKNNNLNKKYIKK